MSIKTSALENLRNIGISAHIDSGKTTLTERILYYCNKIHAIHEVKGKDGVGATMDSMELEKERGITISSAATNVDWKNNQINIIDTPGHVDFTIEVENALRVLDGAILVLCSVGGVQSQTITVDRQLKRYNVPQIAFINKCDRKGANPFKVTDQLKEKLAHNAALLHLPIGLEEKFEGIIDLIKMRAFFFEGPNGDNVVEKSIPEELLAEAKQKREEMLDVLSMLDDNLAEHVLDGSETEGMIKKVVRKNTLTRKFTPVLIGSAYKNKGVQLLLDGVVDYLPSPYDIRNFAYDAEKDNEEIALPCDPEGDVIALAFKLDNQTYGQLTYIRLYSGTLRKGGEIQNLRLKRKVKVGRIIRMHSSSMEDIEQAAAGDIVALFGIDCALGDTFVSGDSSLSLKPMYVPEPIISLAIKAKDKKTFDNMAKALNRFCKEDPTFKCHNDEETKETIISGMGELHLDIYIERMRREYGCDIETGAPQVSYRETISNEATFDYTHKKQTGGRGQYARVCGIVRPVHAKDNLFTDQIKGGVIPSNYVPACQKGFLLACEKGSLIAAPVVGIEMIVNDGNFHPVDSSQQAFETASLMAFREVYAKAQPAILEPLMKLYIETPSEYRSPVLGTVSQRRGNVVETTVEDNYTKIEAEIPLSEVFGYATVLRSQTQGKAEFTLEFSRYHTMPRHIAEEVAKKINEKK